MIILTVGKSYVDIDGYASAIAYRELLKLQGINAKFITKAKTNYSITDSLLMLPLKPDNYEITKDDQFIILDLSNKDFFPEYVDENHIIEIIDHHPGYEDYWFNKLKDKSIIKPIGAVATIIFEKYKEANLLSKMNPDVAMLLMAAILDNTLNFTAKITTDHDIIAYHELEKITNISNYADIYFSDVQKMIETDLKNAINSDLKHENIPFLPNTIGQLTIWDYEALKDKIADIINIMNDNSNEWIINIISLKNNTSYILCSDELVKSNFMKVINCDNSNILAIKPALLRKEIFKKAIDANK